MARNWGTGSPTTNPGICRQLTYQLSNGYPYVAEVYIFLLATLIDQTSLRNHESILEDLDHQIWNHLEVFVKKDTM